MIEEELRQEYLKHNISNNDLFNMIRTGEITFTQYCYITTNPDNPKIVINENKD